MVYGATAPAGPLAAPTRRRRGVAGLAVATLGAGALLGLRVAGPSRARLAALVARPHTQTLVDPVDIRIAVSNEYGPCETDKYPFLYGIDDALLVEPHKTTSLTIENSVAGAAYAWTVGPYANPNDGVDGPSITVTYTKTGVHALSVEGTVDGTATTHRFTVYSKYVRREVRGLKDRDRLAFLMAAKEVWSLSTVEGQALYGDRFKNIDHLTLIHNDLAGNDQCDFIHGQTGYAFVNAHAALGNMLEQSLQSINPEVSLPYWDYSIDKWLYTDRDDATGDRLSTSKDLLNLWDSPIWSADYFGSADPDTGVIRDGAWAYTAVPVISAKLLNESGFKGHFKTHGFASCVGQDVEVCEQLWRAGFRFDMDEGVDEGELDGFTEDRTGVSERHLGNSFGLLRSPWNMRAEPTLVRSRKMCGTANNAQFPDCTSFIAQQRLYDTFEDYVVNLQVSPHGTVHVFTGGAFGSCSETFGDLSKHVDNAGWVEQIKSKSSDVQKNLWMDGLKSCPARGECLGMAQDECSCHCVEVEHMLQHEGANNVSSTYTWQRFLQITLDGYRHERNARDYLESLPEPAKLDILKDVCVDVLTGDMLGSNSPYDVAFFATHVAVERLWQRKALSGNFSDMTWPGQSKATANTPLCPGQKAGYKLVWFDYELDGAPPVNSSGLTNVAWRDLSCGRRQGVRSLTS